MKKILNVPNHIIDFLEKEYHLKSFSYLFCNKNFTFSKSDLLEKNNSYLKEEEVELYPSEWIYSIEEPLFETKKAIANLKEGEYILLKFRGQSYYIFPILFEKGGYLVFSNKNDTSAIYSSEDFDVMINSWFEWHKISKFEVFSYDENNDPLEVVYFFVSYSSSLYAKESFEKEGFLTIQEVNKKEEDTKRRLVPVSPMRWRLK